MSAWIRAHTGEMVAMTVATVVGGFILFQLGLTPQVKNDGTADAALEETTPEPTDTTPLDARTDHPSPCDQGGFRSANLLIGTGNNEGAFGAVVYVHRVSLSTTSVDEDTVDFTVDSGWGTPELFTSAAVGFEALVGPTRVKVLEVNDKYTSADFVLQHRVCASQSVARSSDVFLEEHEDEDVFGLAIRADDVVKDADPRRVYFSVESDGMRTRHSARAGFGVTLGNYRVSVVRIDIEDRAGIWFRVVEFTRSHAHRARRC